MFVRYRCFHFVCSYLLSPAHDRT
jgi:putative transposon-encoded protein